MYVYTASTMGSCWRDIFGGLLYSSHEMAFDCSMICGESDCDGFDWIVGHNLSLGSPRRLFTISWRLVLSFEGIIDMIWKVSPPLDEAFRGQIGE